MGLERFIVDKIDTLRIGRGWTVYKLSQETGINAQTIHNWFDQGSVPKIQYLHEVCQAFGITLADFFAEGPLVELTSEKKALHDDWCTLTPSEQSAVLAIIKSFKDKK